MELVCLSEQMCLELDKALIAARLRVENEDVTRATVTLSFTLELDDVGDFAGKYALKGERTKKGDWRPGAAAQLRLPEEVQEAVDDLKKEFDRGHLESVEFSSGGRSVTLRKRGAA